MKRLIILSDCNTGVPPGTNRYIGPYVLKSHLKETIETIVIDKFLSLDNITEYVSKFVNKDTVAIGISSTLLSKTFSVEKGKKIMRTERSNNYYQGFLWTDVSKQLDDFLTEFKNAIRKKNPKIKLVLGGAKTLFVLRGTKLPSFQKAYSHFDYICLGLADSFIHVLVDAIQNNKHIETFKRDNLTFLKTDNYQDYKECPVTEWTYADAIQSGESLPIEVARGCVFNCKFCYYDKKSSLIKDTETLKNELIYNYEHFGTTVYNFCDDCFNDSRKKVDSICNAIISLPFDIEWITYARADLSVKFPYTFDLMVESGCRGVCFGLESFNYEACKRAGKGVHPDKIKEFMLNVYKKHHDHCFFQASFITGLPYETTETQVETVEWLTKNKILDFASFGMLNIADYDSSLDDLYYDYADYSKSPQKYGFKQISFNPYYWEHSTMDSDEARRLAHYANTEWNKYNPSAIRSIWNYTGLRSVGYTLEDIRELSRNTNPDFINKKTVELEDKENQFIQNYHNLLLERNGYE